MTKTITNANINTSVTGSAGLPGPAVNLYPQLPPYSDPSDTSDVSKIYRLQKIESIKSQIAKERDHREKQYKKIKRFITAIHYVEVGMGLLSGASAGMSIPSLLGVVTAPVGLVLSGMAIGSCTAIMGLKYVAKRLTTKTKKHDQIRILADAKLNTIEDYVSKAIDDGNISHEEFILITTELKNFNELKEQIRTRAATALKQRDSKDIEAEIQKKVEEKLAEQLEKQKKDLIAKLGN